MLPVLKALICGLRRFFNCGAWYYGKYILITQHNQKNSFIIIFLLTVFNKFRVMKDIFLNCIIFLLKLKMIRIKLIFLSNY